MLNQKIRQFLVHSFLYYKLDESIISDTEYDSLCVELKGLIKDKSNFIYEELIQSSMGKESSGFSIRNYPPEIVSASFHLLYQEKYKTDKSFDAFVKQYGYQINS